MFFKRLIALAMTATVVATSAVGVSAAMVNKVATADSLAATTKSEIELRSYLSNYTISQSDIADYTQIQFLTLDGQPLLVKVSGSALAFEFPAGTSVEAKAISVEGDTVATQSSNTSFNLDLTGLIPANALYYVKLTYTTGGVESGNEDISFTATDAGTLAFVKSPIYDFNAERCSEWWTDETSLQECLQPQNDVESDNAEIIAQALEITDGLSTDYEKAFAIYTYIVENCAYNYDQIYDNENVYQDDALTLNRRKATICEGMGNLFVALCRAAGVPAAVSFGIGDSYSSIMQGEQNDNESPNHAWACVCVCGQWYSVDPTWDCNNTYEDGQFSTGAATNNWFLCPLETFSFTHKICDADTTHGIESSGSAGDSAHYSIDRAGVITISGSGEVILPYGCNGFSEIVFEEGSNITSIGERCFVDCDIITSVILPDTLTNIADQAFYTCEDLEYVYIPEGVTNIGESAFDTCDELAYVYIPDSVESIGYWAFDCCSRLVISIPSDLSGFDSGNTIDIFRIIERED